LTLQNAKEDPMKSDQMPMWQRWAQFRFAVIGELLSSPPQKGQLQRAIERLSQQIYRHPIEADRRISLGASTIERWYYKAKGAADPIAALGRKIRNDAGIRWSMSEPLFAALKSQYESHRRWNVQLHYDNLMAWSKSSRD
jgi:putative transposase